jgi:hypothetical protein
MYFSELKGNLDFPITTRRIIYTRVVCTQSKIMTWNSFHNGLAFSHSLALMYKTYSIALIMIYDETIYQSRATPTAWGIRNSRHRGYALPSYVYDGHTTTTLKGYPFFLVNHFVDYKSEINSNSQAMRLKIHLKNQCEKVYHRFNG